MALAIVVHPAAGLVVGERYRRATGRRRWLRPWWFRPRRSSLDRTPALFLPCAWVVSNFRYRCPLRERETDEDYCSMTLMRLGERYCCRCWSGGRKTESGCCCRYGCYCHDALWTTLLSQLQCQKRAECAGRKPSPPAELTRGTKGQQLPLR